ncbi:hypothetical protein THAOC_20580 [Thalassiosira oceanica]|uniref:Uncharacterized protein n=1 Tax=Thalassiosira oceanica TaxID=159749 RepID=K0SE81_THAOC|nr:hypothetical protein THAOC_20580 [Thalassiosira oceanica]|eukprot:EJK59226.1 hypothetical protein THAOC_20580 [Thalassiosira oceanica]
MVTLATIAGCMLASPELASSQAAFVSCGSLSHQTRPRCHYARSSANNAVEAAAHQPTACTRQEQLPTRRSTALSMRLAHQCRPVRSCATRVSLSPAQEEEILPDELTLGELLTMLNEMNVRFPPDASRRQLEDLLIESRGTTVKDERKRAAKAVNSVPFSSTRPTSSTKINNVVDAEVIRECDSKERKPNRNEIFDEPMRDPNRVRRRSRSQGPRQSRRRKDPRGSPQKRRPQRAQRLYDDDERNSRPKRDNRDEDFDVDQDEKYGNGLEIFANGFLMAGQTAAQLALGAVADTINPSDGVWWYDEENERDIFDANVQDFTPRKERVNNKARGRARSTETRRAERRRQRRQYRTYDEYPRPRRRSLNNQYDLKEVDSRGEASSYQSKRGKSDGEYRRKKVDRREEREVPEYGLLYNDARDGNSGIDSRSEPERYSEYREHQRRLQWRDRLRRKFDAALGLETQASSSHGEGSSPYYDSWRTHVSELDDKHKDRLRTEKEASMSRTTNNSDPGYNDDQPPNNRRARQRIRRKPASTREQQPASSTADENSFRPSRPPRSRLDEVPMWREKGTLASLLFDTQPRVDGDRRKRQRLSLLESPFGRNHTVTSLFVYISRSILTALAVMCRWASVRGSIPQPIVVTTAFAATASARSGNRLLALFLTLLGLRLVGEVLHSGLYGNEYWEDEFDRKGKYWR